MDIEKLKELASTRLAIEGAKSELDARREAWEAANRPLIDLLNEHKKYAITLESVIRESALAEYASTGEKSLAGGVKIRMTKAYNYVDSRVLEWARKHQVCLIPEKLDTKAFEKMASIGQVPDDMVTITEVPQATIPTKIEIE